MLFQTIPNTYIYIETLIERTTKTILLVLVTLPLLMPAIIYYQQLHTCLSSLN